MREGFGVGIGGDDAQRHLGGWGDGVGGSGLVELSCGIRFPGGISTGARASVKSVVECCG